MIETTKRKKKPVNTKSTYIGVAIGAVAASALWSVAWHYREEALDVWSRVQADEIAKSNIQEHVSSLRTDGELDETKIGPYVIQGLDSSDTARAIKFIKNGHDPNMTDVDGTSLVRKALMTGNEQVALMALQNGARPPTPGQALKAEDLEKIESEELLRALSEPRAILADALVESVTFDDQSTLDALLEDEPAAVNWANTAGVTPLIQACLDGNVAMVRHLLERDANPNLSAKGGVVPLSAAALSGEPQLAEILVRAGASVDYTGHGGLRPLLAALSVKDREFARNLVELGARPTRLAGDSMFPGDLARSQGMLDLVSEYGLAQSTITPLDVANAVAAGNLEKVKEGIEEGVDPNTRARDGWTLLHVAAINSDREMISWLLKNGADPFIEGPSGESILHTIARARADCTTCLIAINEHLRDSGDGAQEKWDKLVMSRSDSNRTALLEAIVNENYPTAGELISIGRPEQMFREPDKHGVTPLIAVALQGNHVLARRLVRKIPRSEAVNSAGEITPHEIARSRKDYALLASLPDDRDLKVRLDTNVSKSELRHVQSNLRKWGYYKGRLDGVFGPGTAAAVRALFEDRERELRSMSKISGSGWKRRTYSADSGRYLNIFPTKSSKYGKYEWEVLENRTDDRTNIIYRRRSDEWPGRLWKLTKWKSGAVGLFSNSTRGKWKSDRLYYWNE